MPRDISDGLARNVDRAQEKWPDTSETKFIAESIQYGLDTVTEASVGWMELLKVAASLLALTKEAKKASILGEEIVDLSEMDSYTLETESGLPEEVRTCCSPPIVLLGSSAYVMYAQEGNNRSASEAGMMFLDDDDDDGSVKPPKEPVSLDELLQPARVPSAYEVIASWSQKKVRPEWGEEKLGLECLGPGARVIDLEFIWDGHLAVLYTMGELRTHLTVLSRNKGGAWACLPGCTAKVPDDARRLICDERSGVVIVCCASERTQVYTTKEKAWF